MHAVILETCPSDSLDLLSELYVSDGNGFKTSTMRLGADVIVFSRCRGKNGLRFGFSILLSCLFLFLLFFHCNGEAIEVWFEIFLSCLT